MLILFFCAASAGFAQNVSGKGNGIREIKFIADDAQTKYASKYFELKNITPSEIIPFVQAAVQRYSAYSSVQQVTASNPSSKGAILVSTGPKCMPFVTDLVAKLDRPGKKDGYGSFVKGTGITRISYQPKYRAAEEIIMLINEIFGTSEGVAFLDKGSNTIYWKDEHNSAVATLAWVEYLDRPLPQAEIRVTFYEMRESDLRDIGLDYLAWKNGPGVNLLNVGYNAGHIAMDELLKSALAKLGPLASKFSSSWGYAGFFTAPAFDMSFIRILQQSGHASVVAHASLLVSSIPVSDAKGIVDGKYHYKTEVQPEYINIQKTPEGRSYMSYPGVDNKEEYDNPAKSMFTIMNPVICFAAGNGKVLTLNSEEWKKDFFKGKDGGVIFTYEAVFGSVVERSNAGNELANTMTLNGSATLAFHKEKILAVHERQMDVNQYFGLPFFHNFMYLRDFFGTTTKVSETSYIIMTAEANLISPDGKDPKPETHELQTFEDQKFYIFKQRPREFSR